MEAAVAPTLGRRYAAMSPDTLDDTTTAVVKQMLLDYLGVALAGSQTESGAIARRFAREHGGRGPATLIGDATAVDGTAAAFANAISSHSVDLDDADELAHFHFSPTVCSAALAAAEHTQLSGSVLTVSIAAGCDMMLRLSRVVNPALRNQGFDTSSVCGALGATVAASKAIGLPAGAFGSAISLGGAQASGLMEMYGPSMQRQVNNGPAARAGVTAAFLAQAGFTGEDTVIEGRRGFARSFADVTAAEAIERLLAETYPLVVDFKPYPNARPIHAAVDCAIALSGDFAGWSQDVHEIRVDRHPAWIAFHAEPTPQTRSDAAVSLPFAVAVGLLRGRLTASDFGRDTLEDPDVRRLASAVRIFENASLPDELACGIQVVRTDGTHVEIQIDHPKGSRRNPLTATELGDKFDALSVPVVGAAQAADLRYQVAALERVQDVGRLMSLASRRGAAE